MRPSKRFFLISVGALAGILVLYGVLRSIYGVFLPEAIDKNFPDAIIIAAVGAMIWNRRIISDEKKEKDAAAAAAAEASADAAASSTAADAALPKGEGGADAPG